MVKIKAKEWYKTMVEYDFLSFPRAVGNPYQGIVFNPEGLWHFVKVNNGWAICFTSHNSYPRWDGMHDPQYVRFGKLFFDFDHKTKPENPLRDARRLASFLDSEGLPWGTIFSGRKGFHLHFFMERTNRKIGEGLWNKVVAIHSWLRYKGEKSRVPKYDKWGKLISRGRPWLPTLDSKVAEPKRLCRIPFTLHVTMADEGDYIVSPTYCIPIKPGVLYDEDIFQIRQRALNPVMERDYTREGHKLDLNAFIAYFDIDLKYWLSIVREEGEKTGKFTPANYEGVPNDDFAIYISKLIKRPCIHGDLFTENPSHIGRMMGVVELKKQGFSYEETIELFDEMAEKFKWVDRHNRGRRRYQIHHIYYKRTSVGGYWHASCKNLKIRYQICVGDKCPFWFKTEEDKHDKSD